MSQSSRRSAATPVRAFDEPTSQVIAQFHYTDPTRVSDKVRGLRLVGSGQCQCQCGVCGDTSRTSPFQGHLTVLKVAVRHTAGHYIVKSTMTETCSAVLRSRRNCMGRWRRTNRRRKSIPRLSSSHREGSITQRGASYGWSGPSSGI